MIIQCIEVWENGEQRFDQFEGDKLESEEWANQMIVDAAVFSNAYSESYSQFFIVTHDCPMHGLELSVL